MGRFPKGTSRRQQLMLYLSLVESLQLLSSGLLLDDPLLLPPLPLTQAPLALNTKQKNKTTRGGGRERERKKHSYDSC